MNINEGSSAFNGSEHGSDLPEQGRNFDARLQRIFEACGCSKDSDLARALKIKPQSITAARKRKQIPSGWIEHVSSFYQVSADWLFFGNGPMRRGEESPISTEGKQESADCSPVEDFKMSDMITKTVEILESDTIYRTALASNINAFHQAVRNDRTLAEMERRVAHLEEMSDAMSRRMEDLEKENQELKRRMEPPGQKQEVGAAG
ncbi:hypothetical protein G3N56_02315 [Desulfovibrio sulfodismutans]|uniref:Bacteriophage CI repressor N-terminal domain-containing protein n=1 Tax=Desulfolutivibrio sulfodismutans TaxID=63561 RepID=A0A7K3NK31_9BACT|nr:helix-turn-helix domain-containing protein [Desulfolutivibrio sulfodismutans]NDY55579.1 hypothetical protein [Desulfolutivibrio sulfodismutans]